ncbi:ATP-binding protein [Actinomadura soli]|uniref:ATP-binding protein n=1 Tax=Actinomadura soli TaxID=2508997 RepID=A0A5C4IYS0_9ACTN|nr:ATP-binding protein [Actinomadura soli]TMQ84018.1 ATP-binding protein [Actinomadura soli]
MIVLKPEDVEARRGRDHVAEIATAEEWPVDLDDVRVVTAELINNAIGHADTDQIRVEAYSDQDESEGLYVVEVWDADGMNRPRQQCLSLEGEHGRGLHLVAALAHAWGVQVGRDSQTNDNDSGKIVFARWLVKRK